MMNRVWLSMKNINYKLFFALLVMGLCPTIYTTLRVFWLGQLPGEWSFSIAGQLSWVNLFYEIINELRKSKITVIIISHDISCAVHYGNKILHLCGDETFFGDTHDYVHSPLGERMLKGGHCHG